MQKKVKYFYFTMATAKLEGLYACHFNPLKQLIKLNMKTLNKFLTLYKKPNRID